MEYLITFLWTLLDCIFWHTFWSAFMNSDKSRREHIIAIAISTIIATIYCSLVSSQITKQILTFIMYFVLAAYLFKGRWYQHVFYVVLGFVFNALFDLPLTYGMSALLGISYSELVWRKLTYVVTVSIGKLLANLAAWVIRRIRRRNAGQTIPNKWILLALFFPAMSLSMMLVLFLYFRTESDISLSVVIFCAFVAVSNIAIIYLIALMEKSTRETQENALLHHQMDIQTESIVALEKSYQNQRKTTHEYQNQLQTIFDLLRNDSPQVAMDYIHQLQGMQTTRIFAINSHHPIVDAILNHKYQVAKENRIDFQIHVNDLSQITIDTNVLVVLLSNLLDNAIEACIQLPCNRSIQCSILEEETIFISIRNTSAPVTILGDSIPSTKQPPEEHGFGIPHIQMILNQLEAEYTFAYEDGWFEFVAEIPLLVNTKS